MITYSRWINGTNILLIFSLLVFNILNFFDKLTTYIAMNLGGFIELNSKAVHYFSTYGLLQGILLQFVVGLIFSILIFYITLKFLKLVYLRIPIIMGYFYVIINYSIAVFGNIYYLMRYV